MGAGDLVLEPGGHLLALHVGDVVIGGRAGRRLIDIEHEAAGLGDEVREAHIADVRLFLGVAHLLVLAQGLHGDAVLAGGGHVLEGALPPHIVVHLIRDVAHAQVRAMKRVISASGLASYMGSMHFSDRRTVRMWPSGTTSSYSYMSQAGAGCRRSGPCRS